MNVENFYIRGVGGTAGVYNFGVVTGEKQVWSDRSTDSVEFANVGTGAAIGLNGDGNTVLGAVKFEMANATDDVTIALANGVGASGTAPAVTYGLSTSVVVGNVANATITSSGAANKVGVVTLTETTNSVKTVTVDAATNLTATLNATDYVATGAALTVKGAATSVDLGTAGVFKAIDASGLTAGGLTVGLDAVTTSFKGGQGNDVVTTAATTATGAVIDAGAGTADVLELAATNDVTTSAKAAQYQNFEVLRLNASKDVSLFGAGITALQLNGQASAVVSGITATQAANVTVRGDLTTAATLTLADVSGSSDVVKLKFANPTETAAVKADVDVAALKINGVENLEVNLTTGGNDLADATTLNSLTFAAQDSDKLTSIKLSGDRSLDLSLANLTKAITVDTTGLTGSAALKLSVSTGVAGSVINGTANADTIATAAVTGSTGDFVTYNAGAGNDSITTTAAILNNASAANGSVKIDGGAGTDTLTFSETALSLADAQFQYVTGIEKISNTTAGTVNITTGGFFDANNKAAGIEFTLGETTTGATRTLDASSFTGKITATVSNNGTGSVSTVKTGSGDDVVTLTQGSALNTTTHVVSTGDGADTINVGAGLYTITAGKGADVINLTATAAGSADILVFGKGDSTISGADKVTNFAIGSSNQDTLDLAHTTVAASVAAVAGVQGGTSATGVLTLLSGTTSLTQALTQADAAITAGTNGTLEFSLSGSTYVYQEYSDNSAATLIELVGVSSATGGLVTTAAANAIYIA